MLMIAIVYYWEATTLIRTWPDLYMWTSRLGSPVLTHEKEVGGWNDRDVRWPKASFNTLNCHQHIHTPSTPNQTPPILAIHICVCDSYIWLVLLLCIMYVSDSCCGYCFRHRWFFFGPKTSTFLPPSIFFGKKTPKMAIFPFCHNLPLNWPKSMIFVFKYVFRLGKSNGGNFKTVR